MGIIKKVIKGFFSLLLITIIILFGRVAFEKYTAYQQEKERNRERIRASIQNSMEESKTKFDKSSSKNKSDSNQEENAGNSSSENENNNDGNNDNQSSDDNLNNNSSKSQNSENGTASGEKKDSFFSKAKNKVKDWTNKAGETAKNSVNVEVDDNYNSDYLDDFILLYEGNQTGEHVNDLLNKIIENADQNLYSKVDVTTKNMGNGDRTLTFSNRAEYISGLNAIKNSINKDSDYKISFGYSKFKTHVTEVIIEK